MTSISVVLFVSLYLLFRVQNVVSVDVTEVQNWPDSNVKFGQIGGLAYVESYKSYKNVLLVFHRANRVWDEEKSFNEHFILTYKDPIDENTVAIVDSLNGTIFESWGSGLFYMPNGAYVDKANNIWLTDVGSQQVFKYAMNKETLNYTVTLTLGVKLVPGSDEKHFCQPSAVVTVADGSIFVADGYCNSRIVKFTPEGKYLAEWGRQSEDVVMKGDYDNTEKFSSFSFKLTISDGLYPPLGDFRVISDITANEQKGLLYVADRENGRIQVFNYTSGEFVQQIHTKQFGGALYAVRFCVKADTIFALNGISDHLKQPLKVFAISPANNELLYSFAGTSKPFNQPQTIALSSDCSAVFVGEMLPNRLWKFNIHTSNNTNVSAPTVADFVETTNISSQIPATHKSSSWRTILACIVGIPVGAALVLFGIIQCRRRMGPRPNDSIPLVSQSSYRAVR